MGKGNRTRRGPGGRTRSRSAAGGARGGGAWAGAANGGLPHAEPSSGDDTDALIVRALVALDLQQLHRLDDVADWFAMRSDDPERGAAIVTRLVSSLTEATTRAWQSGWQPVDVHRILARRQGSDEQRMLGDVMAHELARYATATIDRTWLAQLRELDATVWWPASSTFLDARRAGGTDWSGLYAAALIVLHTLERLPRLERLTAIPGEAVQSGASREDETARPAVDERILSRVRQLLAKAESTNFEAEAETFTAGAQSLMARHSIDAALLAADPTRDRSAPHGRRIGIETPYEGPKASLLDAVARANRCRMIWSKQLGFGTVVGFEADLESVEVLFTSLLVQATKAVNAAGSRTDAYGNSRTRTFRQSFLLSFAHRIGERLEQVAAAEVDQAAADARTTTGRELVPLLAARTEEVERHVGELFPVLKSASLGSIRDAEGWNSGRAAADRAELGSGAALERARGR